VRQGNKQMKFNKNKIELEQEGFSITPEIYNENEILEIVQTLDNIEEDSDSIIKNKELFAIRELMIVKPELWNILLNKNLNELISVVGGTNYFLTKAIYFDKPKKSNWFVSYHQDLSINVTEKNEITNYVNWTNKRSQIGVQPPIEILENIFTIRIHLDDTSKDNGALRVIPKSHLKGIIRTDSGNYNTEHQVFCELNKGESMLMKPLTLHASSRTVNEKKRRVIHLEFSNLELEKPIKWKEKNNPTHNNIYSK
jgi:ectoine hydroxylase-related dioxygenase (phytanoyl-CoA dioxygenase family)